MLRNTAGVGNKPNFVPEAIDRRHGASIVPLVDLDDDGDMDFLVLFSQEFEEIDAYINQGDGTFERELVFTNNNPGYGSSHMELADIDGDGDNDIAFVNGDSLDTPVAKPYHGVRWLENEGGYPFVVHELGSMPGVHCVRARDIDGDGDIDLATVALLPGPAIETAPAGAFDSVAWFEQRLNGLFDRHRLEADACNYATCELFDWEGDGDLDLIVGEMARGVNADRPLKLFRNKSTDTD